MTDRLSLDRGSLAMSGAQRPVVAFRADGGRAVGLGHVRRSLALAAALAPWAACHLLLHGDTDVRELAGQAGLPSLPVSADMDGTLAAVRSIGAAALVVDSYGVSAADLGKVQEYVRLLVVVDDTGCLPLPAHVVVNSAPGLNQPNREDGAPHLFGPRYTLLAPEFAEPPARAFRPDVRRILLVMGGAMRVPLLGVVAHAVRGALPEVVMDVVVGPIGDDPGTVEAALANLGECRLHGTPESMRALMLSADIAVTAGGVTLSELAATATPTVGICLAPNQKANLTGFAQEGAVLYAGQAGDPSLPTALETMLAELVSDPDRRRALGEHGRRLVDGRGAERVAEAMRARLVRNAQ